MTSLANQTKPTFEQGSGHLLDHRKGPAITNLDIPRQEFTNFSATAQEDILAILSQLAKKVPTPEPEIPRLSSILLAERERLRIDKLVRENDRHPPPKAFVGHFLTTVADPARIPWEDNDDSDDDDDDSGFEKRIMRFDRGKPGKGKGYCVFAPDKIYWAKEALDWVTHRLIMWGAVIEGSSGEDLDKFSAGKKAIKDLFDNGLITWYKFDSIVVFEKAAKTSGRGYKILGWIDGVDVYLFDVLFEGEKGHATELMYHLWLRVLLQPLERYDSSILG
ncbi:hypothetical protein HDV00_009822 [Rhizophlyctis rosea]|nr:hypothetical protein HDV00_009822 [Rhizophlyctis rosea]